ncbi:MAG: hypothetical protein ACI8QQ_002427, partial [Psychroserpens sp.]
LMFKIKTKFKRLKVVISFKVNQFNASQLNGYSV